VLECSLKHIFNATYLKKIHIIGVTKLHCNFIKWKTDMSRVNKPAVGVKFCCPEPETSTNNLKLEDSNLCLLQCSQKMYA
jgi:hypothetical protein